MLWTRSQFWASVHAKAVSDTRHATVDPEIFSIIPLFSASGSVSVLNVTCKQLSSCIFRIKKFQTENIQARSLRDAQCRITCRKDWGE